MKKTIGLIIAINTVIMFLSCGKHCEKKDDKLTIQRTNYDGSLRIDGYYYHKDVNSSGIFILYKNGIVLKTATTDLNRFEDGITKEIYNDTKYGWGAFRIENGNIRTETWEPRKCGYPAYVNAGRIINDSTFVIIEYYRVVNEENYTQMRDTFHFKQTASKPDSTQSYL